MTRVLVKVACFRGISSSAVSAVSTHCGFPGNFSSWVYKGGVWVKTAEFAEEANRLGSLRFAVVTYGFS